MTTHQTQSSIRNPVDEDRGGLLRLALKLDAAASGALGVLTLAASSMLVDLLGTPLALLVPVGLFLIVWAAALWVIASRPRIGGAAVRAVCDRRGLGSGDRPFYTNRFGHRIRPLPGRRGNVLRRGAVLRPAEEGLTTLGATRCQDTRGDAARAASPPYEK